MNDEFLSVHNHREQAVFRAVVDAAERFPILANDRGLLADVACVALNRIQPRYIRHDVDYAFYLTDSERAEEDRTIAEAVDFAFRFVHSRVSTR
ncbi:MAG: hypothetical protein H6R26_2498 [Proteobacteria bacterium]|nr:hypothetical protein [Pseudomonadota bacterium]